MFHVKHWEGDLDFLFHVKHSRPSRLKNVCPKTDGLVRRSLTVPAVPVLSNRGKIQCSTWNTASPRRNTSPAAMTNNFQENVSRETFSLETWEEINLGYTTENGRKKDFGWGVTCYMGFYRGPWKRSAKGAPPWRSLPRRPSWRKARDSILFHVKHFCGEIFSKMGSWDMIWRAAGNVKIFFDV